MALPTPEAGVTHDVVFKWDNDQKQIGLRIPNLKEYAKQPYQPFNPSIRQGEATQSDFAVQSVWEIQNDWSGGTGHLLEEQTQTSRFAFAQGTDFDDTENVGPCLFTARKGRLSPAPAAVKVSTDTNFIAWIEFNGRMFAATSEAAGKIYRFDSSGLNPSLVETLTGAFTQFFADGTTLFACQGTAGVVRKTTDGTTWSNHSFEAYFIAKREENNTAYINDSQVANYGNTLVPNNDGTGPTYRAPIVDLPGTTATNMKFMAGRLWIGKPEGLTTWEQGWFDKVEDCSTCRDTSNFKHMCIHKGLLYYNIKNTLWFTNGDSRTQITPEELNGFDYIDFLYPTAGPLLIAARMQGRSYLFAFNGIDAPGLNPLWSDADATRPIVSIGTTDLYSTKPRIYFTQTTTGTVYLDMKENWTPNTYLVTDDYTAFVELTLFTAGFRSVNKWWYEVVFNVEDPTSNTVAKVFYKIDNGAWTQTVDEDGVADEMALSASNVGTFFPLNTYGVKLRLRIYLTQTDASTAASITAVTVRGLTVPKMRHQFSFPVLATHSVVGYNVLAEDGADNIQASFEDMIAQQYPIKFFDWDGGAYLVAFRTPYPLASITKFREPSENAPAQAEKIYQVLLVEVDELEEDGSYKAWSAG